MLSQILTYVQQNIPQQLQQPTNSYPIHNPNPQPTNSYPIHNPNPQPTTATPPKPQSPKNNPQSQNYQNKNNTQPLQQNLNNLNPSASNAPASIPAGNMHANSVLQNQWEPDGI
eukprot:Phypoly_transcript_01651.p3 GENE.Phypoly_transcript_01651~~Phypoly_transcript_01651.p3  ORF type:complete len:114 (-),score=21.89 Phypoly_transcript_01651:2335-2676(-)